MEEPLSGQGTEKSGQGLGEGREGNGERGRKKSEELKDKEKGNGKDYDEHGGWEGKGEWRGRKGDEIGKQSIRSLP